MISSSSTLPAGVALSGYSPLYVGIDRAIGTADFAFALPGRTTPPPARKHYVNLVRIDLQAPGIGFVVTPSAGASGYQTQSETILDFMGDNPSVALAINANFGWIPPGVTGGGCDMIGLVVSNGQVVSDPTQALPGQLSTGPSVPDDTYVGAVALIITAGNQARIQTVTAATPGGLPSGMQWAIAGSSNGVPSVPNPPCPAADASYLVWQGKVASLPDNSPTVAGRSAAGLSADGRYLFLATLDGLEYAPNPWGGSLNDIANWMLLAGAYTAFNLDGGGSTVMARRLPGQAPALMNVPNGNETSSPAMTVRSVGLHFGIVATALGS